MSFYLVKCDVPRRERSDDWRSPSTVPARGTTSELRVEARASDAADATRLEGDERLDQVVGVVGQRVVGVVALEDTVVDGEVDESNVRRVQCAEVLDDPGLEGRVVLARGAGEVDGPSDGLEDRRCCHLGGVGACVRHLCLEGADDTADEGERCLTRGGVESATVGQQTLQIDPGGLLVLEGLDLRGGIGHRGDTEVVQERVEVARKSAVDAPLLLDGLELVAHARRKELIRASGDVTHECDDEVAHDVGVDLGERVGGQAVDHVTGEDRRLLACRHLAEHVQGAVGGGLVTSEDVVQQDGAEPLLLRSGGGAGGAQDGRGGRRRSGGVEADTVTGTDALQHGVGTVAQLERVTLRLRLKTREEFPDDLANVLLNGGFRLLDVARHGGADVDVDAVELHDVSFPDVLFVPGRLTGLVEQGAGALRRNAERSILKVLSGERSEFLVEPDNIMYSSDVGC